MTPGPCAKASTPVAVLSHLWLCDNAILRFIVNATMRFCDDGRKSTWTRIGAAWPNEDGKGFNIVIAPGVAVSGRIVLREPKPQTDRESD
ncbi:MULTISPECIES: hypothetical protein [unclassified Bradyrhizobium]